MNECVCLRTSADQLHWTGRGEGSGCYYCDIFALRETNVAYSRRICMFNAIYVLNANALISHITMSCTKSFASCHQDYIRHVKRFLLADCFHKWIVVLAVAFLASALVLAFDLIELCSVHRHAESVAKFCRKVFVKTEKIVVPKFV